MNSKERNEYQRLERILSSSKKMIESGDKGNVLTARTLSSNT